MIMVVCVNLPPRIQKISSTLLCDQVLYIFELFKLDPIEVLYASPSGWELVIEISNSHVGTLSQLNKIKSLVWFWMKLLEFPIKYVCVFNSHPVYYVTLNKLYELPVSYENPCIRIAFKLNHKKNTHKSLRYY